MTTFNFGVLIEGREYNPVTDEEETTIATGVLSIAMPEGLTGFSFSDIPDDPPDPEDPDAFPDVGSVAINIDSYSSTLDGEPVVIDIDDAEAIRVTWLKDDVEVTTDILILDVDINPGTSTTLLAVLGGEPLPTFASAAEYEAFGDNNVVGLSAIPDGPFDAGQNILLTAPDSYINSTEDDVIIDPEDEQVFGGLGDDQIRVQSNQTVFGGDGEDDIITGHQESNIALFGGDDDDVFILEENDNTTVDGGDGWDFLYVEDNTSAVVLVSFLEGAMGVAGGMSDQEDPSYVTLFDDIEKVGIDMESGDLVVLGGDENDQIRLYETGPDSLLFFGGDGTDRVELNRIDNEDSGDRGWTLAYFQSQFTVYDQGDGLFVFYEVDTDRVVAELYDVEELRFISEIDGADDIYVDIVDIAEGALVADAETVAGANGDQTVDGGLGDDSLSGGLGNDTVNGGFGEDSINGGQGFDELYGGSSNDTITGSAGFDDIYGDNGDDDLFGNSGNDNLYGGFGDDNLTGGIGNDELYGDSGNDTLTGQGGGDDLFGGDGDDNLNGNAFTDNLYGGDGDDILNGGQGFDLLIGDEGNDRLNGGSGFDDLYGGEGDDTLAGNSGNDTLDGGNGDDILRGGQGADTFVFTADSGNDTISDFSNNIDTIAIDGALVSNFDALKALGELVDGNAVFTFADGSTLTVNNIGNLNAFSDDVEFFGLG